MGTTFGLDKIRVERKQIAAHDSVEVDLPFPPSVNNLFANGSSGRYITQQYKDWRTSAGWKLKIDRTPRLPGPVKITLTYEERRGRRDLDNLLKPVLDLLVEHKIIDGDHRTVVREIAASWSAKVQGVRVTVSPAEAAVAA
jgi:Holliday junction resolvase RusA-like endonuclease